ncbi:MAG: type VI secretion system ImpA family N-terminal domain-containing protein [Paucimonas sp.]|jgi:type VI secretion system protein VasL|nr:type VI secretion system ImpA family N-terminal domain-containing protein [Paucimonas sp.]
MTVSFEMHARAGGDPRHLAEFKALRDELLKLDHPACPDVDWERVEQLCMALFESNGVDLQSLVVFVLARGHRQGLDGVVQGLAVLERSLAQWPTLWPSVETTRLEIFDWLFRRLLLLLRSLSLPASAVPMVVRLQVQLENTHDLLQRHPSAALQSLLTLHRYLAGMLLQLEQCHPPAPGLPSDGDPGAMALVKPLVIMPPPTLPPLLPSVAPPRKRRVWSWAGGLVLLLALVAWAGSQ